MNWNVTMQLTPPSTTQGTATATDQATGFSYSGPVDSSDQTSIASFVAAAGSAVSAQVQAQKQTSAATAIIAAALDAA